jgi:hypothetical protein
MTRVRAATTECSGRIGVYELLLSEPGAALMIRGTDKHIRRQRNWRRRMHR